MTIVMIIKKKERARKDKDKGRGNTEKIKDEE
jgi:hypothetical protein